MIPHGVPLLSASHHAGALSAANKATTGATATTPSSRATTTRVHTDLLWPVSVDRGLDFVLRHLDAFERAAASAASGSDSRTPPLRLFVCHHRAGYHGRRRLPLCAADARVVYTGMLPPAQLAHMYERCSLFVFASNVPEAFCISAWECMAHGVVVVCYGLGALSSLGECGALVVPPGDEDALLAAACALLAHPQEMEARRRRMVECVRRRRLSWARVARLWQEQVFGGGGRGGGGSGGGGHGVSWDGERDDASAGGDGGSDEDRGSDDDWGSEGADGCGGLIPQTAQGVWEPEDFEAWVEACQQNHMHASPAPRRVVWL